jgi:hypothetical protein
MEKLPLIEDQEDQEFLLNPLQLQIADSPYLT